MFEFDRFWKKYGEVLSYNFKYHELATLANSDIELKNMTKAQLMTIIHDLDEVVRAIGKQAWLECDNDRLLEVIQEAVSVVMMTKISPHFFLPEPVPKPTIVGVMPTRERKQQLIKDLETHRSMIDLIVLSNKSGERRFTLDEEAIETLHNALWDALAWIDPANYDPVGPEPDGDLPKP